MHAHAQGRVLRANLPQYHDGAICQQTAEYRRGGGVPERSSHGGSVGTEGLVRFRDHMVAAGALRQWTRGVAGRRRPGDGGRAYRRSDLYEAIEKQLGLKLSVEKHAMPVVIDHADRTPAEQ